MSLTTLMIKALKALRQAGLACNKIYALEGTGKGNTWVDCVFGAECGSEYEKYTVRVNASGEAQVEKGEY